MRKTVAVAASLVVLLAGCGGTTTDRPSTSAISTALQSKNFGAALGGGSGSLNKAAADCLAKAVHDSRISSRGLRALLRGEKNLSSTDVSALRAVVPQLEACRSKISTTP